MWKKYNRECCELHRSSKARSDIGPVVEENQRWKQEISIWYLININYLIRLNAHSERILENVAHPMWSDPLFSRPPSLSVLLTWWKYEVCGMTSNAQLPSCTAAAPCSRKHWRPKDRSDCGLSHRPACCPLMLFTRQQRALAFCPPWITRQGAIFLHHPMAGNQECDHVVGDRRCCIIQVSTWFFYSFELCAKNAKCNRNCRKVYSNRLLPATNDNFPLKHFDVLHGPSTLWKTLCSFFSRNFMMFIARSGTKPFKNRVLAPNNCANSESSAYLMMGFDAQKCNILPRVARIRGKPRS